MDSRVAGCVQVLRHMLCGGGVIIAEQAVDDVDVFVTAAEQAFRAALAGQNTDALVLIVHFQERFRDKTVRIGREDDLVQIFVCLVLKPRCSGDVCTDGLLQLQRNDQPLGIDPAAVLLNDERLKQLADLEQIAHNGQIDRADDRAVLGENGYEHLVLELVQRFAHGCSAHTELRAQRDFVEHLIRRIFAVENTRFDHAVCGIADGELLRSVQDRNPP